MKEARRIHRSGLVGAVTYEGGVLEGAVRDRGGAYRARLKIDSPTDMENLCTCPRARRDGILCAHVLAAGLELIHPQPKDPAAPSSGETAAKTPGAATEKTATSSPGTSGAWPATTETATTDARPAACHVVLSPRFASAWEKGRVMAGVEVEIDGERRLLSAIPPATTLFLDPHDAPLLALLKRITPAEVPGMMSLGREDFLRFLDSLPGHPRVTFGKDIPAAIAIAPYRPVLHARDLRIDVRWPQGKDLTPLVGESAAWVLRGEVFQPVAPGLPAEMMGVFGSGYTMDASLAHETIRSLEGAFEIPQGLLDALPEPVIPGILLDLEGSLNHLEATFTFDYGDSPSKATANPAVERSAMDALTRWGFTEPDRQGKLVLADRQKILRFHAHGFPALDPSWRITTGERFEHAAKQVSPVHLAFDFHGAGEDWFDVSLEYESPSGDSFSRQEIQRLLQTGQNHKQLRDGSFAVIDADAIEDLQQTISDCQPDQAQPGTFRIDRRLGAFLRETAADRAVTCTGSAPWNDESGSREPRPLGALEDLLRPYQREGVEWMRILAGRNMGGVLADDMGLGKTLQALALLVTLGARRTLVVCPSSLVFNWVAEAARFVPEMKTVAIDGPDRKKKLAAVGSDHAVLVTSYALLRRDEETWRAMTFDAVILDEAQQIKNPDSKVAKAACRLRARHRFALTGTPIENGVRDLWSVMHFVMPGYLGARKDFAERFEKPIAGGKTEAPGLERRLHRRLKPVILRRLKSQVAADLPEKIEQTIYCALNAKQREVYGSILRESRASLLDAEGNRKRILALTALLRLRQACCDLRLLGLEGIEPAEASVKLDALDELLHESVAGGHRVLIFSQFVELLQVLVLQLNEKGLEFCYLDGQTKHRADVVNRFQDNPGIPVFLISLKAGGVGLNLTGADTVIHLDPWWNPAVEAQATDRAHRIGQQRAVTSYKLIARDTVEEKILALQEKKRKTIRAVMDAGDVSAASLAESLALSESEIYDLLG